MILIQPNRLSNISFILYNGINNKLELKEADMFFCYVEITLHCFALSYCCSCEVGCPGLIKIHPKALTGHNKSFLQYLDNTVTMLKKNSHNPIISFCIIVKKGYLIQYLQCNQSHFNLNNRELSIPSMQKIKKQKTINFQARLPPPVLPRLPSCQAATGSTACLLI